MEKSSDFLQCLNPDLSSIIFSYLEDPADIVRVSTVSRSWRQYVIANALCRKLFLRLFPEVSSATEAIEENNIIEPLETVSDDSGEEKLERNHKIYAFLARGLSPTIREDCIVEAISATSTDNYPEESVQNTLDRNDRVDGRASYWSSEGESDAEIPEALTYKLTSKLCFVTEIDIHPFQAYFQYGFPIYSAKAVRFRMGHLKAPMEVEDDIVDEFVAGLRSVDDYIEWTYVSPVFPMAQENCLQKFKLPKPVLCVGGILRVELLGRVQQQEMDGLFYICVSHVQVVGLPLAPPFDAELIDITGRCVLKYDPTPAEESSTSERESEQETLAEVPSRLHSFTARLMHRAGMGFQLRF